MIEVQNVSKSYHSKKETTHVLKDITFSVPKGEIVGLLGSNGAGKTTLIKILCNLIESDTGSISINQQSVNHKNKKALRYVSSVLEGNRNIYWRLTIKENVEYFLGIRGFSKKEIAERLNHILMKFELYEKRDKLVKNLSRGMQQKVAIVIALMADTEVVILDEPTLGLDVVSNQIILEFLLEIVKEKDKTIIISSHDMNLIEKLCDRVFIISDGKLITDSSVDELLDLFKVVSYHFYFEHALEERQKVALLAYSDMIELQSSDQREFMKVTMSHNQDIYNIMDLLKQLHIEIASIEKEQVNFEQVFLKIVRGTKHAII
ncbi:ABC transporter ATP-binding protein [Alkalihalophilus lindianensis]|uniref:ABC transporter ATP-binding protein n=1 Tax=Alkalihalophilus lindianensis TaxID=1630542 RepID=A0ABU3X9S8_9BACI|nr:ABC transporter ATP-binding protein [Alkalihalophilus lindianensis]MDV2684377.1 ABC transporter ATP-binding protein [Alkalihalophilus lindianensis]